MPHDPNRTARPSADEERVGRFIEKWQGREGGQERANYALFLSELCFALGLALPDPASATTEENDYVFERVVKETNQDGSVSARRIDLYKKGCFVLEAKQSRQKGGPKELHGQGDLFGTEDVATRGRRGAQRSWDVLMMNALRQARDTLARYPYLTDGRLSFLYAMSDTCSRFLRTFRDKAKITLNSLTDNRIGFIWRI